MSEGGNVGGMIPEMDTIIVSSFGCWMPVRATDGTIGGPHWWHQSCSSGDGWKGEHQLHEVCGSDSPVQCRHCVCELRCNWTAVRHGPWWWYGPYIPSSQLGGDGVGGAFCPVQASPLSCGEWLWVLSTGKGRWQHHRGTTLVASTTHQWVVMPSRKCLLYLSFFTVVYEHVANNWALSRNCSIAEKTVIFYDKSGFCYAQSRSIE